MKGNAREAPKGRGGAVAGKMKKKKGLDISEGPVELRLSQRETSPSQLAGRRRCFASLDLEVSARDVMSFFRRFPLFGGFADSDVVALQLAIESGAADAEHFPGERLVSVGLFKDAENGHAFHLRQRGGGKGSGVLRIGVKALRLLGANGGRQIGDVNGAVIAEGDGASDTIFE